MRHVAPVMTRDVFFDIMPVMTRYALRAVLTLLTASTASAQLEQLTTPRDWTVKGESVAGFYLGTKDGQARIRLDGESTIVTVPLDDLSESDREFIAKLSDKPQPSDQLPVIEPEVFFGKAKKLRDGDSFSAMIDGEEVEIRLHAIDAPERDQPFSQQSKAALSRLIHGKKLRFEQIDKDRYGRKVCRVYVRKLDVNAKLIEIGAAWHFSKYSDSQKLQKLEDKARAARVGLWADDDPLPPWEFRKRQRDKL